MNQSQASTDPHLKRTACLIYTQLPEDKREALLVLRYVRQIIFSLGESWEAVSQSAPILPFSVDPKGRAGSLKVVPEGRSDPRDKSSLE